MGKFFGLILALLCVSSQEVFGQWIYDVWLTQGGSANGRVEMTLSAFITGATAFSGFYKPTEVTFSPEFNKFLIKVYPEETILTVIGGITAEASLGILSPGRYVYEVQVYSQEEFDTPGSDLDYFGRFEITPPINVFRRETNLFLSWDRNNQSGYLLEMTTNLFNTKTNHWIQLPVPSYSQSFVFTNDTPEIPKFFRLVPAPLVLIGP